ncbi:MAG: shikimate kinase [Aliidongia sp.]
MRDLRPRRRGGVPGRRTAASSRGCSTGRSRCWRPAAAPSWIRSTRARISERAISVWLRADLETLLERTSRRQHRPLLNSGDPRTVMSRLIETRYPIYAEADITIDSLAGPTDATVQKLLAALHDWAGPSGVVDRREEVGSAVS